MKKFYETCKWFVGSEVLEWGTYTQTLAYAKEIQRKLVADGGYDARIVYDPYEEKSIDKVDSL